MVAARFNDAEDVKPRDSACNLCRLRRYWPWLLGMTLLLAGFTGLDLRIYQRALCFHTPNTLDSDWYDRTEWAWDTLRFFASAAGGLTVFFSLLVLRPRKWQLPVAGLASCLTADLLGATTKMLVGRLRPDRAGICTHLAFMPFGHAFQPGSAVSFPSGEATAAFALAAVIGAIYPRLRWPAHVLASGVCLARVLAGAHYLSDVAAGAILGASVARWAYPRAVTLLDRAAVRLQGDMAPVDAKA